MNSQPESSETGFISFISSEQVYFLPPNALTFIFSFFYWASAHRYTSWTLTHCNSSIRMQSRGRAWEEKSKSLVWPTPMHVNHERILQWKRLVDMILGKKSSRPDHHTHWLGGLKIEQYLKLLCFFFSFLSQFNSEHNLDEVSNQG